MTGTGAALVGGVWSCASPARDSARPETPAPGWESVLTGPSGITGADGGASVPLPGGRILWLLADSVVGEVVEGRHGPGSAIVNNAIVVHAVSRRPSEPPGPDSVTRLFGPPPRAGANSAWLMPDGQDGPIEDARSWFWPTGGGAVVPGSGSERLVLFYTRVRRPGGAADGTIWNFEAAATTAAVIANPADRPAAWRVETHDLGPVGRSARRMTWGVGVLPEGGDVLLLGLDDTDKLNKKAILARAPAGALHDPGAWRYWSGGAWSFDRADTAPVCDGVSDEFSIHRGGRVWVMIHMEPMFGTRIMLRTAPAPEGPWSEPRPVYQCPEPAGDPRLMVYAARAHPELSGPDHLLVSYCVNSRDFGHMLSDASIYRVRFLRVPREAYGAPP